MLRPIEVMYSITSSTFLHSSSSERSFDRSFPVGFAGAWSFLGFFEDGVVPLDMDNVIRSYIEFYGLQCGAIWGCWVGGDHGQKSSQPPS